MEKGKMAVKKIAILHFSAAKFRSIDLSKKSQLVGRESRSKKKNRQE
jgi:hypothetical protein